MIRSKLSTILTIMAGGSFAVAAPTWTYDPDTGALPNDAGQPFESPGYQVGSNSNRSIIDLGGGDKVLQINTADPNSDSSIYWEIDAPATKWNVSVATGYSTEFRVRMDPSVATEPSAAAFFVGNATNWTFLRLYNNTGPLIAEIQGADGNAGGQFQYMGNPFAWHTYRVDVEDVAGTPTAKLYVDNYFRPVATKALPAGSANAIWIGDGTGTDDGKYQIDYIKSYQSGAVGAPAAPDVTAVGHQLFLAHYDTTGGGPGANLAADHAIGNPNPVANGGQVSASPAAKFGAGSFDGNSVSGTVTYDTAGNFNVSAGTVEMWVNPSNWSDGNFAGFFSINDGAGSDIRIQKTNSGQLQVYMAGDGKSWSLTSAGLSLSSDWHHLAWTWDLNVNKAAIYVDGVVVDDSADLSGLSVIDFLGTLNATFEVGTVQNGSASFVGLIDEFRISNMDLYGGANFTPQNAPYVPEPAAIALTGVAALLSGVRRRARRGT